MIGHGDLWEVLDSSKACGQDTVEHSPALEMRRQSESEYGGQDYGDQHVDEDDSSDHDRSLPVGLLLGIFKLFLGDAGICEAEEDKEKHKSVSGVNTKRRGQDSRGY